jgi:hypothetical protein
MSASTSFSRHSPKTCWPQFFRFLTVKWLKLRTAFISNWQRADSSPKHFHCLSSHSQTYWHLGKTATDRDLTCPCVHWFRCRSFLAFVVICIPINNKKSTNFKLGTCKVNVQRYLWVKYYIVKVFIVQYKFSIEFLKPPISGHAFLQIFFLLLKTRTNSKLVPVF